MEKKYTILISGVFLIFAYLSVTSIIDKKKFCRQDNDCSLVETSCCQGEKTYSCFESAYSIGIKLKNLKCPLLSNGSCAADFKTPPECACERSTCVVKEKNDTAFKEELKNLSYDPSQKLQWGN